MSDQKVETGSSGYREHIRSMIERHLVSPEALKNKTPQDLGFEIGDFIHTGFFPGILVLDTNRIWAVAEVWGADPFLTLPVHGGNLTKITLEQFKEMVKHLPARPPVTFVADQAIERGIVELEKYRSFTASA